MRKSTLTPVILIVLALGARAAAAQTTGSISGTVTLFEGPFETRPDIQVYDATGVLSSHISLGQTEPVRVASTDTIPWTVTNLPPGTYYVGTKSAVNPGSTFSVTFRSGFWVDQLYGVGPCVAADCNPQSGTPVNVLAGQTTSGVNFTLDLGASINGGGTGTFIGAQSYDIFDSRGVRLPNRISGFGPGYVAEGLPTGTYFLLAHRATDGSAPETLYPNIACDGCAVTSGTPVTVALGDIKMGIDFGKPASGSISGTVRSDGSANPPNSTLSGVRIQVYAANGVAFVSTVTAVDGTYSVPALVPGTYFVGTVGESSFVNELYNIGPCDGCGPTIGTPVTVTAGGATSGIDFSLPQGAHAFGMVSVGGSLAANVPITFYTSSPATPVVRVLSKANLSGSFGSFDVQLPPGAYYAQVGPVSGAVEQIYNGVACPQGNCPAASATQVVATANVTNQIDFSVPACTAPVIAPASLANAAVGAAYRQTLLATGASGAVGFSVSSGTLPPGLSLDPNTGVLSGTPTASGNFTFMVSAVDSLACAGSRTYTLDVPPCAFTFTQSSSASLRARGEPWLVLLSNTCGTVTATTDASWITQLSVVSATSVGFVALPNTGGPRQGKVTIGPRVFTVFQSGAVTSPPFGSVDAPADGVVVSGSVGISGWALDDLGVVRVLVYRDPVAGEPPQLIFVGQGTFVHGARPDVAAAFPTLPNNTRAGWGYLVLTNMLPNQGNGTFRFSIFAEDADLNRTLIGTKVINAVNASATAPFGAIDTPDQGATASGSAFVNFGWALTPQSKTIPIDGSTIHVLIDGFDVGTVSAYNLFRSDVSTLFPGLKNSGGPVGYRVIDTTALSEGQHTIAWLATDDGGITTGIGSRVFTVSNSAWQPSLRANVTATPPAVSASKIAQADATTAVPARVDGVDLGRKAASLASLAVDVDGARTVQMSNLQVLELSLAPVAQADACVATYAGYLAANGALLALPVGSSLDPAGTFYWHPGTAFFGTYQLIFVRTSCNGTQQRIPVSVHIR